MYRYAGGICESNLISYYSCAGGIYEKIPAFASLARAKTTDQIPSFAHVVLRRNLPIKFPPLRTQCAGEG
jgi:hypothetical protein